MPTPGGSRRARPRMASRIALVVAGHFGIAAWVAGDIAARYLRSFTLHQGLFPTNLDDARTLLATIAAELLTFTGVVFSIALFRAPDVQYAVLASGAADVRPQAHHQAGAVDLHRHVRLLADPLAG